MAKKNLDGATVEYYDKFLGGNWGLNAYRDRGLLLYQYHVKRIQNLCMARFKWTNLPKTIDVRFLELQLFRSGLALFYYDFEVDKFFAVKASPYATLDMFDNPTGFRTYGNSQLSGKSLVPNIDCIPIWSNALRIPDHDMVMLWAARITEFELTFEINAKNARRPRILVYDDETKFSAQNINEQIDEGKPTLELAVDPTRTGMINAFDLGVDPRQLQELHITRMRLENQMMGELGINNANQDKKERLVSDEVDANNDQVVTSRSVHLNARKFAALQINDLWGLNVQVSYGSDVDAEQSSRVDGADFAPEVPESEED